MDADFRARQREHRLWGYDKLTGNDNWGEKTELLAEAILAGDWQWKGHGGVALDPPIDWDGLCAESRSWSVALHSWEPLAPPLMAYEHLGDRAYLDFVLAIAADWLEKFPSADDESTLAWYDLAVGSRAYRLAYMLDVAARDPARSDELISLLLKGLVQHSAVLAEDERFARHSNHAFYQVMAQLAMARRFPEIPELAASGVQGQERLKDLLYAQFTAEGIHREHSPHYHHSVLIPIRALQKTGLVSGADLDAFRGRTEEALAWFVAPAGHHVMFGDTNGRIVIPRKVEQFANTPLRLVLSGGRTGEPPSTCTRGFPESGYVIFRDRWPNGEDDFADCSYLAQTCAFHSRVHKHADDLSFVWYDRGCDILTDAGRFGYVGKTDPDSELFAEGFWYSDPRRIYVESTRAHNTVETDGRSNPRRGVEPYGSALTQWGERGEVRFSESQICWGGLSHARLLFFLPGSWLLVIDSLADSAQKSHDFIQRFHLAPELNLAEDGDAGVIAAGLPSGDRLHAVALAPQTFVKPVRGVEDPQLLGWISRHDGEFEPQWTFGWEATGVQSHDFASLFCFAQESPRADSSANSISADARNARLTWDVDGESHSISFERVPGKAFEIEYRGGKLAGPSLEH